MSFNVFKMIVLGVLFFGHCVPKQKKSIEGRAVHKIRHFDDLTKVNIYNPLEPDVNIWFRDDFIIRDVPLTQIFTDENGSEKYQNSVEKYEFIDLKSNHTYEYLNFSDTAKIINKYKRENPDNVNSNLFFDVNIFNNEGLIELPDTNISGITYNRVRSHRTFISSDPEYEKYYGKQLEVMITGYLRCDMERYFFLSLEPLFGKKRGCPVMRIDRAHLTADLPPSTDEIEIVYTKITPFEKKVFDAWEKNAKTYR
jgi:hypothetical protein